MGAPAGLNTSWLIKFVRDNLTQNPLPAQALKNAPVSGPGQWQNINLLNGWSNYGGGWARAQYQEMDDGLVIVKGLIACSSAPTIGMVIGEMSLAPSESNIFICDTENNGNCRVNIDSTGAITWTRETVAGGSQSYVSLSGINFIAAS